MTNIYRQIYGDQLTPEHREADVPAGAEPDGGAEDPARRGPAAGPARSPTPSCATASSRSRSSRTSRGASSARTAYTQTLAAQPDTVADFETELRDELLMKKLNDALAANLYVSEDEIQQRLPRPGGAGEDPLRPAAARPLRAQVAATPAEVEAYFQAHKAEFKLPEQRDLAYLLVNSAPSSPSQVKVTDAGPPGLLRRPQGRVRPGGAGPGPPHPGDGQRPAQRRRGAGRASRRPRRSSTAAPTSPTWPREYSDDTASKDKGGDVGSFGRNRMVKEFEDAAFGAQPGKVVGPVKSSFGYHLIEVTDKRPGGHAAVRGGQGADPRPPHRRAHPAARREPRQGARHPPRRRQAGQRRGPEGHRRARPPA